MIFSWEPRKDWVLKKSRRTLKRLKEKPNWLIRWEGTLSSLDIFINYILYYWLDTQSCWRRQKSGKGWRRKSCRIDETCISRFGKKNLKVTLSQVKKFYVIVRLWSRRKSIRNWKIWIPKRLLKPNVWEWDFRSPLRNLVQFHIPLCLRWPQSSR